MLSDKDHATLTEKLRDAVLRTQRMFTDAQALHADAFVTLQELEEAVALLRKAQEPQS